MFNFKAPVVRRVTVPVSNPKKPAQKPSQQAPVNRKASTPVQTNKAPAKPLNAAKASLAKSTRPTHPRSSPSARRPGGKRKASTPTVQFSSSDDDSDSSEEELLPRKRAKTSSSLEPDLKRRIRDTADKAGKDGATSRMIHGIDLTKGNSKDFKQVFADLEEIPVVELQYPSALGPERFELVVSRESEGFKPLEDIIHTVEQVLTHYFPDDRAEELLDDNTGFPRRLKRAIFHGSVTDFRAVITEYNSLVCSALADGTISGVLDNIHTLPLPLIERVLSQVYSRTVSPRVHTLRAYQNGTDNVYGELLPRFCHEIFRETHLTSDKVFVDLGSGVGNVVLQAALETGAQSWGIEMMPNPCELASLQATELTARARLWGLNIGPVHLLSGDFLATPAIDDVLRRADVVLVNNQAFNPDLNDKLVMKFLDLKDGCKVVSLKNFALANKRNTEDPRNILDVMAHDYFSDSVSWTDAAGTYFIAVKDSRRMAQEERRERRRS